MIVVDLNGNPAVDADGNKYTYGLRPNEDPDSIARVLTRELRKALMGDQRDPDGPIGYPRDGSIV